MRSQTIEITVGLFVLSALGALLWLSIKVSGLTDMVSLQEGYLITSDFQNIGGLKVRSRVTVAGVPVGRVVAIDLNPHEFHATVTMLIQKNIHALPQDSTASILTAGLLGDNYIGITPGFEASVLAHESHIPIEQTDSALVLERLISRFMANQASQ